jgi:hypothetical protein
MDRITISTGLLCAAFATLPAWAGRPLHTDDAYALEPSACEFEGVRQQLSARSESSGESAATLSCGFGWNSQVGLSYALASGSDSSRGLQLGGKTRIWGAEPDGAALTLAWAVGAGRSDGEKWRHEHNEFTLVGTVPLGPGAVHLNLGHARDLPSGWVYTPWGLAWEHQELDWSGWKWAPMAEVFGDDHGESWWNTGARFNVRADQLSLNFSYGCRFGSDRTCLASVGFKLAF